jgi:GH24 family phage-related lysozyme (muramidase)
MTLVPRTPSIPASVLKKGAIPAAFLAALTSPMAYTMLERWEGNILHVYKDNLAHGVPTFCAGRTDWEATVGEKLTSDDCKTVNKITLLEYGYAVLGCANWDYLTPTRLIALTMFAVNVGKEGACNSQAIRQINAGKVTEGCRAVAYTPNGLPNWSSAGGSFVQGLHNRRRAEMRLCLGVV